MPKFHNIDKDLLMTLLPKDLNDNVIPALRLKENGAHNISVSSTSNTNATAFNNDTKIISIYSTTDIFITFGVSDTITADSTDHFFPAGVYYDISIGGGEVAQYTHIAAIQSAFSGTLYISEKS